MAAFTTFFVTPDGKYAVSGSIENKARDK